MKRIEEYIHACVYFIFVTRTLKLQVRNKYIIRYKPFRNIKMASISSSGQSGTRDISPVVHVSGLRFYAIELHVNYIFKEGCVCLLVRQETESSTFNNFTFLRYTNICCLVKFLNYYLFKLTHFKSSLGQAVNEALQKSIFNAIVLQLLKNSLSFLG